MLLFTIAILIGGPGSALAGNNYDDVYESVVDKDMGLIAEDIKTALGCTGLRTYTWGVKSRRIMPAC